MKRIIIAAMILTMVMPVTARAEGGALIGVGIVSSVIGLGVLGYSDLEYDENSQDPRIKQSEADRAHRNFNTIGAVLIAGGLVVLGLGIYTTTKRPVTVSVERVNKTDVVMLSRAF